MTDLHGSRPEVQSDLLLFAGPSKQLFFPPDQAQSAASCSPQTAVYATGLGFLHVQYVRDYVLSLSIRPDGIPDPVSSPFSDGVAIQVEEYLCGSRKTFSVPCLVQGTAFQQEVWRAVSAIPYGKTAAYSEIAASIGRPSAVRAVASACARNPVWLLIPCHRVIGRDGQLHGYAGGAEMKRKLLEMELAHV